MTGALKKWLENNELAVLFFLIILFVLIRLPGVDLPLHQDEYKWPIIVNPTFVSEIGIPHPPLSELIYRTAGKIVGFNTNFRFVPLFFGTINLLLLYYLVKALFGRREATVAGIIWVFSYFSVLASLMVDTDGQIMPFFFLLALIGYFKSFSSTGNKRFYWLTLMVGACLFGFLVKVSFLLAIGAIVADFLWSKRSLVTRKDIVKYGVLLLGGVFTLILLLFIVRFIFPFFNLAESVKYWEHFFVLSRGWFQTAIQCFKALLFASPFLVLIPFFGEKKDFSKTTVFIFFLIFAFLFYVVLFDFSIGALDRYLQLMILPLTVITSVIITPVIYSLEKRKKEFLFLGFIVAAVFVLLQSIPHSIPPLHPKAEWIQRLASLKWNFVYPFSGGSGPIPFYVSFLFIGLSWIVFLGALVLAKIKPSYKSLAILFLIPIGLFYNLVFIEEYLVGHWNGNAAALVSDAVLFIKTNPDIKMVTVYNDNGGAEVQATGKYRKRLYVDPKFDVVEKLSNLNKYKEHYLVVDIPRIDPTSIYQKYFDSCKVAYKEVDKKISATIYDCRGIPDVKL